ncbi:MAG: acyl-CoA dehydrogenase family protein [Pseudomonadota bacterium]
MIASSGELKAIRETAARFARGELAPEALERDRFPFAEFNWRAVESLAALGFLAPTWPESQGGPGLGWSVTAAIVRAVAFHDASPAMVIFTQSLARRLLCEAGPATLEAAFLPPPGAAGLIALPMYHDPDDPPDGVRARAVDRGFELDGGLDYLACLPAARAALVPAVGDGNIRFFLVDVRSEGVAVGPPAVSLGLRGCPAADLELKRVQVPNSQALAPDSAAIHAELANQGRVALCALVLGVLEGCFATAVEYSRERFQARKKIVEHDMIRRMLAEMKAWIDVGGLGVERLMAAEGEKAFLTEALSLQELLTKAVSRATADGVQVLGGYGYMKEYGQEKRMRDAKQLQAVFGGPRERLSRVIEKALAEGCFF